MIMPEISGGNNTGFATVQNIRNDTNETLLAQLSAVQTGFGSPLAGDVKGEPSILYHKVTARFDVFVMVRNDKIIIGKIASSGNSDSAEQSVPDIGAQNAAANSAVDALLEMIVRIENGESIAAPVSIPSGMLTDPFAHTDASRNQPVKLIMKQPFMSVTPQYTVYTEGNAELYSAKGNLTRHSFSIMKNGEEVINLKRKYGKLMAEYTIQRGGEEIAHIKKRFRLVHSELHGTVLGQPIDIEATDLYSELFHVHIGGTEIFKMERQFGASDVYHLEIYNSSDMDLVMALAVRHSLRSAKKIQSR